MLQQTGERLTTEVYAKIMVEHLHRYAFASYYVNDKVVLDIACGEGYGSNLLTKHAAFVFGVDISPEAVQHASELYQSPKLKFLAGSATDIPLENETVDVVVSFETIEHLSEHQKMISECKRVMKENGILIISTPDKKLYSDDTGHKNPFHVKELYCDEFVTLIGNYFSNLVLYRQGIAKGGIIYTADFFNNGLKVYRGDYRDVSCFDHINSPEFLIIVASDKPFESCKNSFFESDAVDASLLYEISTYKKYKVMYDAINTSTTYRFGKAILSPLQFLRSFLMKKR